jgi:predicted nucleic acid-binding protein
MQGNVFVDTNIFVYAKDASEPAKQSIAASVIRELWVERRGRTSVQVLNEFYVTVTRKLVPGMPRNDAWDTVQALLAWAPLVIDARVLYLAREVEARYHLSWSDSMVVAAADLQQCDLLLTEDLQHGMVCGTVRIWNPFEAQVDEAASTYVVRVQPAARHRPRGRPRSRPARSDTQTQQPSSASGRRGGA